MKEKIKIFLLNGLICYSIIILFLMIMNIFNFKYEIELYDNEANNHEIISLKKRVNKLDDSSCKNVLNDMINVYEQTSYDGKVELTELYKQYWDGPSFLAFYNEIKEQCNITDDEMKGLNFPHYTINSILYMEEIVPKYMMQYEINIKDLNIREISEPNTINLSYGNSKESQLIMIETLLDYIGG